MDVVKIGEGMEATDGAGKKGCGQGRTGGGEREQKNKIWREAGRGSGRGRGGAGEACGWGGRMGKMKVLEKAYKELSNRQTREDESWGGGRR